MVWCAQIVVCIAPTPGPAGARDARVTEAVLRPSSRRTTSWTVETAASGGDAHCERVSPMMRVYVLSKGVRGGGARNSHTLL